MLDLLGAIDRQHRWITAKGSRLLRKCNAVFCQAFNRLEASGIERYEVAVAGSGGEFVVLQLTAVTTQGSEWRAGTEDGVKTEE